MTAPQSHPEDDRSEEGAPGSTTGISAAAATHPHTRLLDILGRYRALQQRAFGHLQNAARPSRSSFGTTFIASGPFGVLAASPATRADEVAPEDRFIRDAASTHAAVNSFGFVPDSSEEEDFQSAEEDIPPPYSRQTPPGSTAVFRPEMAPPPRYEGSWFDNEGREHSSDNGSRHEEEDEHGPDTRQDDEHGSDNASENGEASGDDAKRPFRGYPQYRHLLHGSTWTGLYGEKEFPDPQKVWYPKVIRDRVMVMGRTAHTGECDSPCDHCKQKGLHCIVWKKSGPPKPFRANATCLHCFSSKRTCKRTPKPAPKLRDVPPSKPKANSTGKKPKKAAVQPEAPHSDQVVPTTPGGSSRQSGVFGRQSEGAGYQIGGLSQQRGGVGYGNFGLSPIAPSFIGGRATSIANTPPTAFGTSMPLSNSPRIGRAPQSIFDQPSSDTSRTNTPRQPPNTFGSFEDRTFALEAEVRNLRERTLELGGRVHEPTQENLDSRAQNEQMMADMRLMRAVLESHGIRFS